jgi:hypothetical protein
VLLPSITCFCPESQSFDIFILLLPVCYNSKWYNRKTMATGSTTTYGIPYPLSSDPVNVHEDIQALSEAIETLIATVDPAYRTLEVTNNSGSSIAKGDPVYISGYGTSKPRIAKCDSDDLTTFPFAGLAQAAIANGSDGVIVLFGVFSGVNTNAYEVGNVLYVANNGGLTATRPATGSGAVAVVAKKNATTGILLVGQPKGNGTWGSLKAGLA